MKMYSILYHEVQPENLAVTMRSGDLEVLATPQMIAWMEEASCKITNCDEGMTTVGILMNVTHDAPSALHARVRVVSELVEQNGKIYTFNVSDWQGEKCLGKGVHKRATVNAKRFMEKLHQN